MQHALRVATRTACSVFARHYFRAPDLRWQTGSFCLASSRGSQQGAPGVGGGRGTPADLPDPRRPLLGDPRALQIYKLAARCSLHRPAPARSARPTMPCAGPGDPRGPPGPPAPPAGGPPGLADLQARSALLSPPAGPSPLCSPHHALCSVRGYESFHSKIYLLKWRNNTNSFC